MALTSTSWRIQHSIRTSSTGAALLTVHHLDNTGADPATGCTKLATEVTLLNEVVNRYIYIICFS